MLPTATELALVFPPLIVLQVFVVIVALGL
jgi:hypothetical protein